MFVRATKSWHPFFQIQHHILRQRYRESVANMGVAKKTRKFAAMKRVIGQRDARLKKNQMKGSEVEAKKKAKDEPVRQM